VIPDLLPFDHLTPLEDGLWGRFYSEMQRK